MALRYDQALELRLWTCDGQCPWFQIPTKAGAPSRPSENGALIEKKTRKTDLGYIKGEEKSRRGSYAEPVQLKIPSDGNAKVKGRHVNQLITRAVLIQFEDKK
jgi:hypothetical protein